MPSFQGDGMQCETVHEAVAEATARARKGDGPTLLEMKTYRYRGHSMSDPASYRTKEEVEGYKSKDPIENVLNTIKKNKYASEKELEAIEEKVKAMVEESVKFAEDSPYPTVDELYKDVYTQEDYPYIMD
jgi:pyruvate dehydrogenase E1 component alpha subunit